ncbi:MAG: addiction module protein [Acidobacteriota bacterium]|nr:addiction module protein [Acidobacteriota bacterium]
MKKTIFHRMMRDPDFKSLYDEFAVKSEHEEEISRLKDLDSDEAFSVSAECKEEILRRCREIDEGKVNLIPAEKVFAKLDRELK